MVPHSLAKYAKNITDIIYWVEDSPPPAVEALYQDSLHIIEWMNALFSKKKKNECFVFQKKKKSNKRKSRYEVMRNKWKKTHTHEYIYNLEKSNI